MYPLDYETERESDTAFDGKQSFGSKVKFRRFHRSLFLELVAFCDFAVNPVTVNRRLLFSV